MSNNISLIADYNTNSFALQNIVYAYSTTTTLQTNNLFDLIWDSTDEWYYFNPKSPGLAGGNYNLVFALITSSSNIRFVSSGTAVASTPIYINNNDTIPPPVGYRYEAGYPNLLTGCFSSETEEFSYYYSFHCFNQNSLSHQYFNHL